MKQMHHQPHRHVPRIHHVSLGVPDGASDIVRAFYGEVLGFPEKQPPTCLDMSELVWFAIGDEGMELHCIPDRFLPYPGEKRHFCVEVDELETCRHRLEQAGYVVTDPDYIPNRPRFFCNDPFGNLIEFTIVLGPYPGEQ